jgi:hypothetical protein
MIRLFSILGGLFFAAAVAWSLLWGVINFAQDGMPKSVERAFHKHPKELALASDSAASKSIKKSALPAIRCAMLLTATSSSLAITTRKSKP